MNKLLRDFYRAAPQDLGGGVIDPVADEEAPIVDVSNVEDAPAQEEEVVTPAVDDFDEARAAAWAMKQGWGPKQETAPTQQNVVPDVLSIDPLEQARKEVIERAGFEDEAAIAMRAVQIQHEQNKAIQAQFKAIQVQQQVQAAMPQIEQAFEQQKLPKEAARHVPRILQAPNANQLTAEQLMDLALASHYKEAAQTPAPQAQARKTPMPNADGGAPVTNSVKLAESDKRGFDIWMKTNYRGEQPSAKRIKEYNEL
jgi:hypothetical protein